MGSGFSKMKKQARVMQEQYAKAKEDLDQQRITGSSEGGFVTVTLDGNRQMHGIEIRPDCVDPRDVEGLQDLILSAYRQALAKTEQEGSSMNLGGFFPSFPS